MLYRQMVRLRESLTLTGMTGERSDGDCPCGTSTTYLECCGVIHAGGAGLGRTAEQLMRSRYTAYVRHDAPFLMRSWHEDTRPLTISFDPDLTWLSLEILSTQAGSGLDSQGVVEFVARFRRGDEHLELHETSAFSRVAGDWVYVDGS